MKNIFAIFIILVYGTLCSPNNAMPRGIPKLPVFPISDDAIKIDLSCEFCINLGAINTNTINTNVTITIYKKGENNKLKSIGCLVSPQKVNIGCKKYIDISINVFSLISSLNIFLETNPIAIKRYIDKIDISAFIR